MVNEKHARLAWAATGRSVSALETIVKSGKPVGVMERLAAAVKEKTGGTENESAGYDIDTTVADDVFNEHCEAMKASVEEAKKRQAATVTVSEAEAEALTASDDTAPTEDGGALGAPTTSPAAAETSATETTPTASTPPVAAVAEPQDLDPSS